MPVTIEQIRRQEDAEKDCGLYAIQNLYVWAGLEPPSIQGMSELVSSLYTISPEHFGVTTIDQMAILGELRFPLLFALATIPPALKAEDVFPMLLDQGCAILMGFHFTYQGQGYGHSVVAESYSEIGVEVLCSGDAKYQGTIQQWEMDDTPEDLNLLHGNKSIIPWRTQEYPHWVMNADLPLGIRRDFIIVWPNTERK